MAFKSAMVPLTAVSDTSATVSRALVAARALGAHLEVVFVRPDPEQALAYTGLEPADFDLATRDVRDRVDTHGRNAAERARRSFHEVCETANVPHGKGAAVTESVSASWHSVKGEPAFVFPDLARSVDVAIFTGALARYNILIENLLEATLLQSGTPVMLLPETLEAASFEKALVAWDGGPPASRAVFAWLSSGLARGEATLLHVSEIGETSASLDSLAGRLAWHGVRTRDLILERHLDAVGPMLLSVAREQEVGLIVMGGYGKSRYREAVFGGVTRYVIRHTPVPVLMMH